MRTSSDGVSEWNDKQAVRASCETALKAFPVGVLATDGADEAIEVLFDSPHACVARFDIPLDRFLSFEMCGLEQLVAVEECGFE